MLTVFAPSPPVPQVSRTGGQPLDRLPAGHPLADRRDGPGQLVGRLPLDPEGGRGRRRPSASGASPAMIAPTAARAWASVSPRPDPSDAQGLDQGRRQGTRTLERWKAPSTSRWTPSSRPGRRPAGPRGPGSPPRPTGSAGRRRRGSRRAAGSRPASGLSGSTFITAAPRKLLGQAQPPGRPAASSVTISSPLIVLESAGAAGPARRLGDDPVLVGDHDLHGDLAAVAPDDHVGRLADRGHRDEVDQVVQVDDLDPVEPEDHVADLHARRRRRATAWSTDSIQAPRGRSRPRATAVVGLEFGVELDAQRPPVDPAVGQRAAP